MRVCPSVSLLVDRWVTRFFQTAEFEWKLHRNDRITIAVKIWNITCPLTIEKKIKKKLFFFKLKKIFVPPFGRIFVRTNLFCSSWSSLSPFFEQFNLRAAASYQVRECPKDGRYGKSFHRNESHLERGDLLSHSQHSGSAPPWFPNASSSSPSALQNKHQYKAGNYSF